MRLFVFFFADIFVHLLGRPASFLFLSTYSGFRFELLGSGGFSKFSNAVFYRRATGDRLLRLIGLTVSAFSSFLFFFSATSSSRIRFSGYCWLPLNRSFQLSSSRPARGNYSVSLLITLHFHSFATTWTEISAREYLLAAPGPAMLFQNTFHLTLHKRRLCRTASVSKRFFRRARVQGQCRYLAISAATATDQPKYLHCGQIASAY